MSGEESQWEATEQPHLQLANALILILQSLRASYSPRYVNMCLISTAYGARKFVACLGVHAISSYIGPESVGEWRTLRQVRTALMYLPPQLKSAFTTVMAEALELSLTASFTCESCLMCL